MPFHCWTSNLTFALVFFSNSAARSFCHWSGEEPSITQTVSVSPAQPSAPAFLSSPLSPPHAAMETIMPAIPIAAISLRFTRHPSLKECLEHPRARRAGTRLPRNGLDQQGELGLDLWLCQGSPHHQ